MKKILAAALVLTFLLAGCGSKPSVENHSDITRTKTMLLYFSDGKQNLVGEQRQITYKTDESLVKKIIEELVKGPTVKGYAATLPAATKVNTVHFKDDTVAVDLSGEFLTGLDGGSELENLRIYSIVDTLTELSNIKKVQFSIDGQKGKLLGQTELDGDFVRDETVIKK